MRDRLVSAPLCLLGIAQSEQRGLENIQGKDQRIVRTVDEAGMPVLDRIIENRDLLQMPASRREIPKSAKALANAKMTYHYAQRIVLLFGSAQKFLCQVACSTYVPPIVTVFVLTV